MVLHVAKGSFSDDVAHISFPTEVDKVRNEVIAVEEFGSWAPAYVIGGDGAAKVPASYIERDALFSEAGVQKLNQLAGLVDIMDLEAQKVFAGALMVEHAKCLDDVLRVAGSLDSYELFPSIKTDEELGHFLVDTGPITGKFVFAEEAKPYLDYAKIGAEQRKQLGGTHTEQGFVKRREVVQTQKEADRPAFALTLVSPPAPVVWTCLPRTMRWSKQKKRWGWTIWAAPPSRVWRSTIPGPTCCPRTPSLWRMPTPWPNASRPCQSGN